MEEPQESGPDGSSIKPVSSLRARFENMNYSPAASVSSSRTISPIPKDGKPLAAAEVKNEQLHIPRPPTLKPKPAVKPKPLSMQQQDAPPVPHSSTRPVFGDTKASSSSSARPTPSVVVLSPRSPPIATATTLPPIIGNRSPFLDASDANGASSFLGRSPSPLTVPSRSLTPTPSTAPPVVARSPRQGSPRPPSPPPPRRSGELRRDRDIRSLTSGWTDKHIATTSPAPSMPSTPSNTKSFSQLPHVTNEVSPFTSPPDSPAETTTPPELPARPRPPSRSDATVRYIPESSGFMPPPTHHTAAAKRIDAVDNKSIHANGSGQRLLEQDIRPALPERRKTHDVISRNPLENQDPRRPPRLPRPNGTRNDSISGLGVTMKSMNLSTSTPSTAQFLPPPPTRSHTRSKTLESDAANAMIPQGYNIQNEPRVDANATQSLSPLADISATNRRPPFIKKGCYEIPTKYEPRRFDICGNILCTSGHYSRGWDIMDGEQLMSLAHTEGVKATALAFKPSANPENEGKKLWVGTNTGDMMEVDVVSNRILCSHPGVHGKNEVIRIHRYFNEIWSLDEAGTLLIWGPESNGMPNLDNGPTQTYKVPKGHTFSLVADDELWYATGKQLRVFAPSLDGSGTFQSLIKPLTTEGAGDINAGTTLKAHQRRVFFGHNDGKISIYSTSDYSCEMIVHVSGSKINSMTGGVGGDLWLGHNAGKICIYDTMEPTWTLKKEWQAHDNTVHQLKLDPASAFLLDRFQVVSLGGDGKAKIWDALLQEDKLEQDLKRSESQYCGFDDLKTLVMTWNAGACTPHSLRYSDGDSSFFRDLLQTSESPDILVFGFQELVDLENKAATAKRFLKSKKKDGPDQEHMSHQYRDWRDFLLKSIDDYMPGNNLYHLLYTAPLVGLFTCIFVKSTLQGRIRDLHGAEVKRGMGGLHGNKGAIAVRFQVDDSSLCFVNCHLAAGQTQTSSRHADVAAILEANLFPVERDAESRLDSYIGGGDGGLIVDHEICILNGDLNYRIDTMSRDTVVKAVKSGNINKLLERDQLLVARRKNPAFRLRAFEELPISFKPTYKYDVGTDNYDTSEKRRSPAWCDRLLFRGRGKVEQLDYQRHEVRVSDHRPVTGSFSIRTKTVDAKMRAGVWMECQQRFDEIRQQEVATARTYFLEHICGFDQASSRRLIKDKLSGKRRSPSRGR